MVLNSGSLITFFQRVFLLFLSFNFFPLSGCYAGSDEIHGVVIIVIGGIVIVAFFTLYSLYMQSCWKKLAQDTGLNYSQASQFSTDFALSGKRQGREVGINTFTITRGSGRNRRYTCCVRITVKANADSNIRFRLLIEGLLDKLGKATGLQKEIEIGSPDFDKKFLIKGEPDEREYIVEILNRKVQGAIKKLTGIFSPTHFLVNVSGPEVIIEYSKQNDVEFIKNLLKAAELTAGSIEETMGHDE